MFNNGLPGVKTGKTATPRKVLISDRGIQYVPGGVVIDGSKSRDTGNTGDLDVLRAGTLLGKITASGKYAPSIIGLTTALHDTSEVTTTLTLPAAVVTEIQRRIGASGTFKLIGPPSAGGTVDVEVVTYSAIASSTTLTITQTSADFAAGSIVAPNDGSESPLCLIGDSRDAYGIKVTDDNDDDQDTPLAQPVIGGLVDASQIVHYSSDTAVKAWTKKALNGLVFDTTSITYRGTLGGFVFDDDF